MSTNTLRRLPGVAAVCGLVVCAVPAPGGDGIPGCPSEGSCFEAHNTPGCDDEACCQIVCAFDPFCCDTRWDNICAQEALDNCDCTPPDVPTNDLCENALEIGLGRTKISNVCATAGGPSHEGCTDGFLVGLGLDVWYKYVATFSGDLIVSTCDQVDRGWDVQMATYAGGDCQALSDPPLACNQDGPGCSNGSAELILTVSEGACYLIRIGGQFTGGVGKGSLGTGTVTLAPLLACSADANGDGVVDVQDLLAVIKDWSCTDPPGPCLADVTGDGVVDVLDLVEVISFWGRCQGG